MVEKSEMDNNENYLEVRNVPALSWCREKCCCQCSCRIHFLSNFLDVTANCIQSLNDSYHNLISTAILALQDEFLAVFYVVCQCQRESVCKVHSKPNNTWPGKLLIREPTLRQRKTRFNCKLLLQISSQFFSFARYFFPTWNGAKQKLSLNIYDLLVLRCIFFLSLLFRLGILSIMSLLLHRRDFPTRR